MQETILSCLGEINITCSHGESRISHRLGVVINIPHAPPWGAHRGKAGNVNYSETTEPICMKFDTRQWDQNALSQFEFYPPTITQSEDIRGPLFGGFGGPGPPGGVGGARGRNKIFFPLGEEQKVFS